MEKQAVKTIIIKSDGAYVSPLAKPEKGKLCLIPCTEPNMYGTCDCDLIESDYKKALAEFNESIVRVQEPIEERVLRALFTHGNPSGLLMEVKEVSKGWVPSHNDPDNQALAENGSEWVAICSYESVGEKPSFQDLEKEHRNGC